MGVLGGCVWVAATTSMPLLLLVLGVAETVAAAARAEDDRDAAADRATSVFW